MNLSRLRNIRKSRKFTQQNMADALGLSLNGYQKYEQGERLPPIDALVVIADMLDVSIDWLVGRDAFLKSHGVFFDESP